MPLIQVSNLREHPELADTIADRGWHAWWVDSGVPLTRYRAHLEPMLKSGGIPFCLVAQEGGTYVGSVLVIENDLGARPEYAPWIAALWVEPAYRRQGVAARLIATAYAGAAELGYDSCYLCATSEKGPYYAGRGFRLIESGVDGLDIFVKDA